MPTVGSWTPFGMRNPAMPIGPVTSIAPQSKSLLQRVTDKALNPLYLAPTALAAAAATSIKPMVGTSQPIGSLTEDTPLSSVHVANESLRTLIGQGAGEFQTGITAQTSKSWMSTILDSVQNHQVFTDTVMMDVMKPVLDLMLNPLGYEITRPLGEDRALPVAILAGSLFVYSFSGIIKEYARRMSDIGSEKLLWPTILVGVPFFTQMFGTDFLLGLYRGHVSPSDFNTGLVFSYAVTWFMMAAPWAWIGPLSDKMSGPFVQAKGMLRSLVGLQNNDVAGNYLSLDSGFHHERDGIQALRDAVKSKDAKSSIRCDMAGDRLATLTPKVMEQLKGTEAEVTISDITLENYVTVKDLMLDAVAAKNAEGQSRFNVNVVMTFTSDYKNTLIVNDAEGTLLSGSVIAVPKSAECPSGRKSFIHNKSFSDIAVWLKEYSARTGTTLAHPDSVYILSGTVQHEKDVTEEFVTNPEMGFEFDDAVFAFTLKGSSVDLLPWLGEGIGSRTITDYYIPLLCSMPWTIRRVSSWALNQVVPTSVRKSLRLRFQSLPISLTIVREGEFSDEQISSMNDVAKEWKYISKLAKNPEVPFTRAQIDFAAKNEAPLTLKVSHQVLLPTQSEVFSIIPGLMLEDAIVNEEAGHTVFKFDSKVLSHYMFGMFGAVDVSTGSSPMQDVLYGFLNNSEVRVLANNPLVNAATSGLMKVKKEEEIAIHAKKHPPTASLDTVMNDTPNDWSAVMSYFAPSVLLSSVLYGRLGNIYAKSFNGGLLGATVLGAEMLLMGFGSPAVILATMTRSFFLTVPLNRTLEPSIRLTSGDSGYSSARYFAPGMFALAFWGIFVQQEEQNGMLYSKLVTDLTTEDRVSAREELANDLADKEREMYETQPGDADVKDAVRKKILMTRLSNNVTTGVAYPGDARLLAELFSENLLALEEQSGAEKAQFKANFRKAIVSDTELHQALIANAEAFATVMGN